MAATAKTMFPVIGCSVAVRFESIVVNCTVEDAKTAWGKTRIQVRPKNGHGEQWVEFDRVIGGVQVEAAQLRVPAAASKLGPGPRRRLLLAQDDGQVGF